MKTVKELKKGVYKKDKINFMLFMFIFIITISFTVGYGALNQELKISGEAAYRVDSDIRITNVMIYETKDGAAESYKYYNKYGINTINVGLDLPNKDSTVTYEIEVTNFRGPDYFIEDISWVGDYTNYLQYTLKEIEIKKDIIKSTEKKTFKITFSYQDTIKSGIESLPENKTLLFKLEFKFKELETYTISYDLNGAENPGNPTTYNNLTNGFELKGPTKKGHSFIGWTGSNGIEPQLNVKINQGTTGDLGYKANFSPNTYKLIINLNGGTLDGETNQSIIYGNTITINNPERMGYIFDRWTLSNSDSKISKNQFTMGAEDTTLTAIWTPITYTINYNCNGGSGSTSSSSHTYGVSKNLTANGCYKISGGTSGKIYSFEGWATSPSSAVIYTDGQSVSNLSKTNGSIDLYAVWSTDSIFTYTGSYNVLDDGNGNWRIKFLTSGTYTSNKSIAIDAFLVGGGGGGGSSSSKATVLSYKGSGGGGGGKTLTRQNISLNVSSYNIVVGIGGTAGNSGGTTTAFGSSASGGASGISEGAGGSGGSGGGGGGYSYDKSAGKGGQFGKSGNTGSSSGGTGQNSTTCEFGQGTTSGCNSGVSNYASGGSGGSGRGDSGHVQYGTDGYSSSVGGLAPGAGSGGSKSNGGNASPNTGSGGGGASFHYASYNVFGTYYGKTITAYQGGSGGSGIVVIRNKR